LSEADGAAIESGCDWAVIGEEPGLAADVRLPAFVAVIVNVQDAPSFGTFVDHELAEPESETGAPSPLAELCGVMV
jgi:hypothetical protein